MNTKALIPLVVGLGVAGIALKLGMDFVKRAKGAPSETTQVWTANQDIPRGVLVEEHMIQGIEYPSDVLPPGSISDKEQVVGRVVRTVATQGLPITESVLLPPGAKSGLTPPKGYLAVAVRIDEASGVDNHLEPGSRVDVVAFMTILNEKGAQQTIARTILENVEVGAVGPRLSPVNAGNSKNRDPAKQRPARAVTLFVKPGQPEKLHLAEQKGKLKLAMRGVGDSTEGGSALGSVGMDDLLGRRPSSKTQAEIDKLKQQLEEQAKAFAEQMAALGQENEAPAAPVSNKLLIKWKTRVINGNQMRLLGWSSLTSMEPIDLTDNEDADATQDAAAAMNEAESSPEDAGEEASEASTPTVSEPTSAAAPAPPGRLSFDELMKKYLPRSGRGKAKSEPSGTSGG